MREELKQKFREYSELVLFGEDSEAERFIEKNPKLKEFVDWLKMRDRLKRVVDGVERRLEMIVSLEKFGVPRNMADILARETYTSKQDMKHLALKYHTLTNRGMSPVSAVAALAYEVNLAGRLLSLERVVINYISSSPVLGLQDLGPSELLYSCRLSGQLRSPGALKEVIKGIRAAEEAAEELE